MKRDAITFSCEAKYFCRQVRLMSRSMRKFSKRLIPFVLECFKSLLGNPKQIGSVLKDMEHCVPEIPDSSTRVP